MFTKNNFKQRIYVFFKEGASGEQVGDIEKIIIVKNLFKI